MKLKILIIEDDNPIGNMLEDAIKERLKSLKHEPLIERCPKIRQSKEKLKEFRPHVVTLDLKDQDDPDAGKTPWEFIRDTHFCPVVFFSALPLPPEFPDGKEAFAQYLNKNEKKPIDVAAKIEEFIPNIIGLEEIRNEIESSYAQSLQKVSCLIWSSESDSDARKDAFMRITRRRLAAALEYPLKGEKHIKAWEQFLYPPIGKYLCTGDILWRIGGNKDNPADYRVVLSPPCDLIDEPNRHPVEEVLLAKCISVKAAEVLRKTTVKEIMDDRRPNPNMAVQLGKKLANDNFEGMLVIPKLVHIWPAMILNLKLLHIVGRTRIRLNQNDTTGADAEYVRLASMDSPFREALSWRFTHSVGRPGYPEYDQEALSKDIEIEAGKV